MSQSDPQPGLEPGYDVPALPGMAEDEIETPALILDLDVMEANIALMAARAKGTATQRQISPYRVFANIPRDSPLTTV